MLNKKKKYSVITNEHLSWEDPSKIPEPPGILFRQAPLSGVTSFFIFSGPPAPNLLLYLESFLKKKWAKAQTPWACCILLVL